MGMTNAEKQAAWRARRDAELTELRAEVARLKRAGVAQPTASAADIERLRQDFKVLSGANTYVRSQLAKAEAANTKLRQQVKELREATAGGWPAPPSMTKGQRYKQLKQLCHEDKHSETLKKTAKEVTQWLNATTPRRPRGTKLAK